MSLKYFHLVFLFLATVMDAVFWAWTFLQPDEAARAGAAHLSPYAGWLCLLLVGYSAWYITKKMRTIIV